MKRPRPHIPFSVRVKVAGRHLVERGIWTAEQLLLFEMSPIRAKRILPWMLSALFGQQTIHLDHDPPLRAREFNERTGKYKPAANDPDYLVYRTAEDHKRKTNLRGDGAQYADRVLIKRARRRDKPKRKSRPISSRPFPKVHRPFRSRHP